MIGERFITDFKESPVASATKVLVNAVGGVVGYRLWTNKPLTTFDKITFTIGLFGISFMVFLMLESPLVIEGDY